MKQNVSPVYTTLVLVTDQFSCERLIKSAHVISQLTKTKLAVLSVMREGVSGDPDALEHLFGVSREYGAQMTVQFSDHAQSTIVHFIREHHVVNAITGMPHDEDSILVRMWKTLQNVTFFTVTERGELHEVVDREYHQKLAQAGHHKVFSS